MIRSVCNALVWVVLTIGLPSALYAMTIGRGPERDRRPTHRFRTISVACQICRIYRMSTKHGPRRMWPRSLRPSTPGDVPGSSTRSGDRWRSVAPGVPRPLISGRNTRSLSFNSSRCSRPARGRGPRRWRSRRRRARRDRPAGPATSRRAGRRSRCRRPGYCWPG